MAASNPYYEPSGRFPLAAVGACLALALTGIVLGTVYGLLSLYVVRFLPLLAAAVVRPVLAVALGMVLTVAIQTGLHGGRSRSKAAGTVVAVLTANIAYYASWVTWVFVFLSGHRRLDVGPTALFGDPGLVLDSIVEISVTGGWHPLARMGPLIWSVWALEALPIFFFAVGLATSMPVTPFCEGCNVWCEGTYDVARLPPDTPYGELRRRLESKDWGFFESLGNPAPGDGQYYRLDLHSCPVCDATHTLSVSDVAEWSASDGCPEGTAGELVRHLLIDADAARRVRGLGARPAPTGVKVPLHVWTGPRYRV